MIRFTRQGVLGARHRRFPSRSAPLRRDSFDTLDSINADTGMTDKEEEDYTKETGLEP